MTARDPARPWGIALSLLGVLAVIATTAVPGEGPRALPWCLRCALRDRELVLDVLQNLLLYVPLGAGLRLAGTRPALAVSLAVALSGGIETLQATVLAGRFASVIDLAANVLGAVVGGRVMGAGRTVVRPGPRLARRLALGAALAWLASLGFSDWALRPSSPPTMLSARLGGAPAGADFASGRTVSASLDGNAVRDRQRLDAGALRLSGSASLRAGVILVPASPMSDRPPGLRVVAADRGQVLLLGQDGADAVLRIRRHATDLRLETPMLRLRRFAAPRAEPPDDGAATPDTLQLTAVLRRDGMQLVGDDGRRRWEDRVRLNASQGWALLVPLPPTATGRLLLGVLWTAFFLVPLGFWSMAMAPHSGGASAPGRATAVVFPLLVVATGLGVIPAVLDSPPPGWIEWAAALAALAAGSSLGWATERRRTTRALPSSRTSPPGAR